MRDTATEVLAACLAFNHAFRRDNESVEAALVFARNRDNIESFMREAECTIEGLANAGFKIVDMELQ